MVSEHVSVRMSHDLVAHLDEASQRARVTRSEMVKALVEEGLRMREHPGIVFRDGPTGRRASLVDGPDVWEVVSVLRNEDGEVQTSDEAVEWAAQNWSPGEHLIRRSLRYYADYPEEIEARIRLNDEEAARAHAEWLRTNPLVAAS